jgi:hypothetical protein
VRIESREEIITLPDGNQFRILYKRWMGDWYWEIEDPFVAFCCNRTAPVGPFSALDDALIDVHFFCKPFLHA